MGALPPGRNVSLENGAAGTGPAVVISPQDTRAQIAAVLRQLTTRLGAEAALLVSRDGLPVAVEMAGQAPGEADAWAAATATLASLAEQLSEASGCGEMEAAVFRAERCWFSLRPLPVGFLAVMAKHEVPAQEMEAASVAIRRATHRLASAEGKRGRG